MTTSLMRAPRRTARRATPLGTLALVVLALTPLQLASAQHEHAHARSAAKTARVCRAGAAFLKEAAKLPPLRDDATAVAGRTFAELQDSYTVARLLDCGPIGAIVGATMIRLTRFLTDTGTLNRAIGAYDNLRDTAVFRAALDVAGDPVASIPARVLALRTLWVLDSGKFWIGYNWMLPSSESTALRPRAGCGAGVMLTDTEPYWRNGSGLPADAATQTRDLVRRLWSDASQPIEVRAAASCLFK